MCYIPDYYVEISIHVQISFFKLINLPIKFIGILKNLLSLTSKESKWAKCIAVLVIYEIEWMERLNLPFSLHNGLEGCPLLGLWLERVCHYLPDALPDINLRDSVAPSLTEHFCRVSITTSINSAAESASRGE